MKNIDIIGKTFMFTSTSEELEPRSGEMVTIIRKLSSQEVDEEVGVMYEVEFLSDKKHIDVYDDELTAPISFGTLIDALNGAFKMDNDIHIIRDGNGDIFVTYPHDIPAEQCKVRASGVADFIAAVTKQKVVCEPADYNGKSFRIAIATDNG